MKYEAHQEQGPSRGRRAQRDAAWPQDPEEPTFLQKAVHEVREVGLFLVFLAVAIYLIVSIGLDLKGLAS